LATREANLRHRYGIGVKDYDAMYEKQEGKCAICGIKRDKNLDVDHCHDTGKIRGLLCNCCNQALGLLNDDENIIKKAAEYVAS
jgi:hypothetical protein